MSRSLLKSAAAMSFPLRLRYMRTRSFFPVLPLALLSSRLPCRCSSSARFATRIPEILDLSNGNVLDADEFAREHSEVLPIMTGYCGCADASRVHAEDCYIQKRLPDASCIRGRHGFGWGIRINIARGAILPGKNSSELIANPTAVHFRYRGIGPATGTPTLAGANFN